ncbi:LysR family transcriptional regulator (plasmid) [Deinococcus sp. KNUC1210]|uniref:LysR family transcriptional regulator n=1 Tax=Deinococcus sp. KNUC1210 TaxID=2917691 RepID=UPI001EEFD6F9|nr:LysR family transcriptional regulator [Deinococcus sp. KNUC1210]ULH17841.1 LysR family transcriptional regulator [Deinococcus sp. KNUC1210]
MAINPDHLLTFIRVARLGNLSAAAGELHLTQPAVSNQIKLLTQAVGEPLLTRHRYGVRLTPAGEGLLPYAMATSRALEGARQYAADLHGLNLGTLTIAASSTIAATILPGVLAAYHARFPNVVLHVQQGNTQDVMDLLLGQKCELALIEGPVSGLPLDLKQQVFRRDTLRLVVAPGHPFAARTSLSPDALQGVGVIWREPGSGTREVAKRALERAGIQTREVLTLTGTEAVKEAVISGLGAAFLSEASVRRDVDAGRLLCPALELPGLERDLSIVSAEEELLSRAVRVFFTFLV